MSGLTRELVLRNCSEQEREKKVAVKKQTLAARRWRGFRKNRRGYYSLLIFSLLFGVSLFAEVLSNDKPYWSNTRRVLFPLAQG
ncbi:hypothetical protein VU13_05505, partial [Desulfobulbus sp. US5]|nr:hypothetical protein [Desulfobulbus sp. US5]